MNCTRALKWFKQFNPCASRKERKVAKLRLISLDKALSLSLKRQAVRILDSINH